jgi:hypothetical protein
MRRATAVRLVMGSIFVAAPGQVLAAIGAPDRDDPAVRLAARVLGGRLVLHGAADLAFGPGTRRLGIAVELAHAASMIPVAVRSEVHRRTALTSAGLATAIAALDLQEG